MAAPIQGFSPLGGSTRLRPPERSRLRPSSLITNAHARLPPCAWRRGTAFRGASRRRVDHLTGASATSARWRCWAEVERSHRHGHRLACAFLTSTVQGRQRRPWPPRETGPAIVGGAARGGPALRRHRPRRRRRVRDHPARDRCRSRPPAVERLRWRSHRVEKRPEWSWSAPPNRRLESVVGLSLLEAADEHSSCEGAGGLAPTAACRPSAGSRACWSDASRDPRLRRPATLTAHTRSQASARRRCSSTSARRRSAARPCRCRTRSFPSASAAGPAAGR